jgi:hypothetical protein
MALELLSLSPENGIISENAVAEALAAECNVLLFNGLHVGVVVGDAVEAAKGRSAARLLYPEDVGCRMDVVVYHPEEEAIYIGLSCRMKDSDEIVGTTGQVIRKGTAPASFTTSWTSFDTAAGILEWMNALDLKLLAGLGDNWV